jgi:(p)ppGpp synthase/HD superfamily hydrolase
MTVEREQPRAHQFAQTNLQLYNQLRGAGYGQDDLALIRRCYDLAVKLFAGSFRPTGKPFLAHLVGTASVLAEERETAVIVGAGLLHAAYAYGDFALAHRLPGRRRRKLREATNVAVEMLVARYTRFEWNSPVMSALVRQAGSLPAQDRDVVLIRLANELEDMLDLGLRYCGKGDERGLTSGQDLDVAISLARAVERPRLAKALQQALTENRTGPPPPQVLRRNGTAFFRITPGSQRVRYSFQALRLARGWASWALKEVRARGQAPSS